MVATEFVVTGVKSTRSRGVLTPIHDLRNVSFADFTMAMLKRVTEDRTTQFVVDLSLYQTYEAFWLRQLMSRVGLVRTVISSHDDELCASLQPPPHIQELRCWTGSWMAPILVVGDKPNKRHTLELPFHGNSPSADMVMKSAVLRDLSPFMWFCNVNDDGGKIALTERYDDTSLPTLEVIALGSNASRTLSLLNIEHRRCEHPAHAWRFGHWKPGVMSKWCHELFEDWWRVEDMNELHWYPSLSGVWDSVATFPSD